MQERSMNMSKLKTDKDLISKVENLQNEKYQMMQQFDETRR